MASPAIDTALGALQAHFDATDVVRRLQGDALAALGLGASESPYSVIASGSHWRLRDYGHEHASKSLLIIAAPIKRPYIWDLAPSVSAIRFCLEHGLRVRLLEWIPASRETNGVGLDECALAISKCVALAAREDGGLKPFLSGHSLGGTLAAITQPAPPIRSGACCCSARPCAFSLSKAASATRSLRWRRRRCLAQTRFPARSCRI